MWRLIFPFFPYSGNPKYPNAIVQCPIYSEVGVAFDFMIYSQTLQLWPPLPAKTSRPSVCEIKLYCESREVSSF